MLKKLLITAGLLLGLVAAALIIARVTGYLAVYKMPTPANEPGLRTGETYGVTKFLHPELKRFITYKSAYKDAMLVPMGVEQPGANYVNRLCGLPGDKIQMKNGVLFVNNKNFDLDIDLYQEYKIAAKDIDKIEQEDAYADKNIPQLVGTNGDSVFVTFNRALYNKYHEKVNLVPFFINDTSAQGAFKWLNKRSLWTVDNFGPLTIPKDSCFVLGDNRHNALDSRYAGFVAIKDITGVVFGKL